MEGTQRNLGRETEETVRLRNTERVRKQKYRQPKTDSNRDKARGVEFE